MDFFILKNFLSSYSLPSIIIAIITSIAFAVLFNFFKVKLPSAIKAQLPFISSVVLYFAYDMIFVSRAFVFKDGAFVAGIFSGSLSVIITSIIKKICRGEIPDLNSATAILIEGLLEGVIPPAKIAATAIAVEELLKSFNDASVTDKELARQAVQDFISERADDCVTEVQLYSVAALIVETVKTI